MKKSLYNHLDNITFTNRTEDLMCTNKEGEYGEKEN